MYCNALDRSDRKKFLMMKYLTSLGFTSLEGVGKPLLSLEFPHGSYTLQIHLISTISSGNAKRWICTIVLATTGLPEKTSCLHLTLAANAASISVTNSTSSTTLSIVAPYCASTFLTLE